MSIGVVVFIIGCAIIEFYSLRKLIRNRKLMGKLKQDIDMELRKMPTEWLLQRRTTEKRKWFVKMIDGHLQARGVNN